MRSLLTGHNGHSVTAGKLLARVQAVRSAAWSPLILVTRRATPRAHAAAPSPSWPAGQSCRARRAGGAIDIACVQAVRPDEPDLVSDAGGRVGIPARGLADLCRHEVNGEHLKSGVADGYRAELTDDLATFWRRHGCRRSCIVQYGGAVHRRTPFPAVPRASHTIERGGGLMALTAPRSSSARSQPISEELGRYPSVSRVPGYRCRLASSSRYTVLIAHAASSRCLARPSVIRSPCTAIGSRIGCTNCSSPPRRALLHVRHRPLSSVTWKCRSFPTSRESPASSATLTVEPGSTLRACSSHLGITSSSVGSSSEPQSTQAMSTSLARLLLREHLVCTHGLPEPNKRSTLTDG